MQRPNLSEEEFADGHGALEADRQIAVAVYRHLVPYCDSAASPNPDDSLESFFGIDPDELEGVVENLFEELELPRPTVRAPEAVPSLKTAADLVEYLSRRRTELSRA